MSDTKVPATPATAPAEAKASATTVPAGNAPTATPAGAAAPPNTGATPKVAAAPAATPPAGKTAAPSPAPGAPATPSPPQKPFILIVGSDPAFETITEPVLKDMGAPTARVEDGLKAWTFLSRNPVGLIFIHAFHAHIGPLELLLMVGNDNEFGRIPVVVNGRAMNASEKVHLQLAGVNHWFTSKSNQEQVKETLLAMYDKPMIVINVLTDSLDVEAKIKAHFKDVNVRFKFAHDSLTFFRRLETASPDILMIDLRFSSESVLNIIKITKEDHDWSKIPCITVGSKDHPLQKAASSLGVDICMNENQSKTDARRIIPLVCKKNFFEMPLAKYPDSSLAA